MGGNADIENGISKVVGDDGGGGKKDDDGDSVIKADVVADSDDSNGDLP